MQSEETQTKKVTIENRATQTETFDLEIFKNLNRTKIELANAQIELANAQIVICELNSKILYEKNQSKELKKIVDATKTKPLFWELFLGYDFLSPLQRSLIHGIYNKNYDECSREFWINMFLNMSRSQFKKLSNCINGPSDGTIARWRT